MRARPIALVLALALSILIGPVPASADGWAALREGSVVALIRHARAPGVGDPPGFRLDDCATQRNLSDEGRRQAADLGAAFVAAGVDVTEVLTSAWCRTEETARLAFGRAERWEPLNSFFSERPAADRRTEDLRRRVAAWRGPGVLVMVTHQVNVTALTGIVPRDGEVVVVRPRPGGFDVVDRVP
jgi:phosphohistidine phosphatase SixA